MAPTPSRWHVSPDGRRFRTYIGRCICDPCWQARCECGHKLTAHDFDEAGAIACALSVMDHEDPHGRPDFGHKTCPASAQQRLPMA